MQENDHIQTAELEIDQLNQQAWDIRVSDSTKSEVLSSNAIKLAEKINYTKGKAEGLRTLGFCYIRLSKHEEANDFLKESFSLFELLNDLRGLSTVYEYFGIIQRSWGNFGNSLELLLKSLELSEQTNFTEAEVTNLYQIGVTYKQLGNYDKALEYLFKSHSLAQSTNFLLMVGYAVNVIGSIYFETGDFTQALNYYQQGLIIRQQSGDKWGEAGSLDNIGSTYLKQRAWQQAIDYCTKSLIISRSTGDKKGEANALFHLAETYKQINNLEQARKFCNESLQIRHVSADKKGEAEIRLFLAELQRGNDQNISIDVFQELYKALTIAEEIKAPDLLSKIHWAFYESYKISANYLKALSHLEAYINLERGLHKDVINQKILNLEISYKAEETKKETEAIKLRNDELIKLNEKITNQKIKLEEILMELKATQHQLIQSEKMASLGELTAGIAHEIQNPLNFVNNFSEVNEELLTEMKDELTKGKIEDAIALANDVIENQKKINHHGKRADAIVKGMLQHSSSGSGKKEPTDINALADEYLRLAYHGLRAKDKSFNATMKTDFDETIGNINIIHQDIGRVILNLITNAFYVVNEKSKQGIVGYEPTVSITTGSIQPPSGGRSVQIKVSDNGGGIPHKILDKIFQPFFTTKPTGQGTGLGLSLSYDIVKAHGGELKVETKEGEGLPAGETGSTFSIMLPL
jgi:signal transduction histidine kinase